MTKTTQTATSKGVDCWIPTNHGNDENHENPGYKTQVPQNLDVEKPENHESQRRDRILRFYLRLGIGHFSPHFWAVSLLD